MAITLAQLRTQVRQRADMENSQFVSDSELTSYVNAAAAELHDLLVERYEDYFTTTFGDGAVAEDSGSITMPADMLKLKLLLMSDGSQLVPLRRIDPTETLPYLNTTVSGNMFTHDLAYHFVGNVIQTYPSATTGGQTFHGLYVKCFTPMSLDSDTLFTAGELQRWSEYVVVDAAIRCLQKEESDVSVLMAQKVALIDRIKRAASGRDAGRPSRVVEIDENEYIW